MFQFAFSMLLIPALAFLISFLCGFLDFFIKERKVSQEETNMEASNRIAVVCCSGLSSLRKQEMIYEGPKSCKNKDNFFKGPDYCKFSCLGDGDCIKACSKGAISIRKGLAMVNEELCDGCGECIAACPRGVLQLKDADKPMMACKSIIQEENEKTFCEAACTNCYICVENCPKNAIYIDNKGFHVNMNFCISCGSCENSCPKGLIHIFRKDMKDE